MKKLISFFEIPAADFKRAVKFYETILSIQLAVFECDEEKMAIFPEEDGMAPGAISYASDFYPSKDGVLISLYCNDINVTLALVEANKGKVTRPKTKIEVEGRGYFATFIDSEGNGIGLYSDN